MTNLVTINGRQFDLPLDRNGYWTDRMHHDLYRLTVEIATAMFHDATSAIDVGCYTSGLLCELDWIDRRVAADVQAHLAKNWAHVPDVDFVAGDAFVIDLKQPFDLVISNQTVEHVDDPIAFINRLLELGSGLIVSTTYEVPAGMIDGHVQDPISLEKFRSWFPCELDAWFICHHPTARELKHIVGVVKQSHPARSEHTPELLSSDAQPGDELESASDEARPAELKFKQVETRDAMKVAAGDRAGYLEPTDGVTIYVTTPCLNANDTIDRTIMSVVSQAGDFRIRFHVQDGGSNDGTVDTLRRWEDRLGEAALPIHCKGIEFSFDSVRDKGMYDALVTGVGTLSIRPFDFMTWINADDIMMPWAMAFITQIAQQFSPEDISWVGGAAATIRDDAPTALIDRPTPTEVIRGGLCDGRHWDFVQQEGVFWRNWLWDKVDPEVSVRPFNYAGDWNLWRLFAQHASFIQAAWPLGAFRVHEDQISGSARDQYLAEIEATVASSARTSTLRSAGQAGGLTRRVIKTQYPSGRLYVVEESADHHMRQNYWERFGEWPNALTKKSTTPRLLREGQIDPQTRRLRDHGTATHTQASPLSAAPAPHRKNASKSRRSRHPTKADSFETLKQMGVPVGTILDVGVQTSTAELLQAFPDKHHVLMEPVAEFETAIRANYGSGGVSHEVVTIAICDRDGAATLQTSTVLPGQPISHARMVSGCEEDGDYRVVAAHTLDSVVAERTLAKPYLLKIDVDGAELSVLEGAKATLSDCSIVVIETVVTNIVERCVALREAGFQPFDIVDLCYYADRFVQADMVFLNSRTVSEYGLEIYKDGFDVDVEHWVTYRGTNT